ncbi:unnamed protein product, partial [Amoebophrya sp. A120]|eukprot:GSA120T00000519001.1
MAAPARRPHARVHRACRPLRTAATPRALGKHARPSFSTKSVPRAAFGRALPPAVVRRAAPSCGRQVPLLGRPPAAAGGRPGASVISPPAPPPLLPKAGARQRRRPGGLAFFWQGWRACPVPVRLWPAPRAWWLAAVLVAGRLRRLCGQSYIHCQAGRRARTSKKWAGSFDHAPRRQLRAAGAARSSGRGAPASSDFEKFKPSGPWRDEN